MALTESYMLPLGTHAPNFILPDVVSNKDKSLQELKGEKGTLIIFMCNHCPYVVHLMEAIVKTAEKISNQGIATLAISSNSITSHPQDGPKKMRQLALEKKFSFPYLFDASQEVAHQYQAACTPDFYLFDNNLGLVYRGRYDASRPGNDIPITGEDLHQACDKMLNNHPMEDMQYPSLGCNIKWHQGNSPEERA